MFREKTGLFVVEEGELIGGFGSEIARLCAAHGAREPIDMLGIGDRFVAHGSVAQLLEECALMPEQIAARFERALGGQERTDG